MKLLRTLPFAMLILVLTTTIARGFYDEVDALKKELAVYETAHATNFADVLQEMDQISGSVFTDVGSKDWFQPYVASLNEWSIVSGYKDASGKQTGTFKPSNHVTIAEALKMTLEAAKVDQRLCVGTPTHKEAVGHWAQMYVVCGEKLGMRVLKTDALDLNRTATRGEIVAMVDDAFGDKVPSLYSEFKDTTRTQYESDIAFATLRGIVSGDKDAAGNSLKTFRPNAAINRAEVSKIVYLRLKIEARKQLALKGATPAI